MQSSYTPADSDLGYIYHVYKVGGHSIWHSCLKDMFLKD